MRFYELLYIARSDLTTTQVDDLNNLISNIIKGNTSNENGNSSKSAGSISKIDSWGVKSLAYKSKKLKRNKGYFCLIHFSLDSSYSVLKELNNRLKLNESILRFVIKQVDGYPANSNKSSNQHSDNVVAN